MIQLTARLMFQIDFLLSHGETVEVVFVRGEVRHLCNLVSRGTTSTAHDCKLVCSANGRGAIVPFEEIFLTGDMAARLEAMAADADAIHLAERHRAHVAKGREFWRGVRAGRSAAGGM